VRDVCGEINKLKTTAESIRARQGLSAAMAPQVYRKDFYRAICRTFLLLEDDVLLTAHPSSRRSKVRVDRGHSAAVLYGVSEIA
jgi:hypothetical protein